MACGSLQTPQGYLTGNDILSRPVVLHSRVALLVPVREAHLVTEETIQLELNEIGLAPGMPSPQHPADRVHDLPYRPVEFHDDDLPAALSRCAKWLREAQDWLGEPIDVLALHLDCDEHAGSPYYELKLLCNEEDLAGVPLVIRRQGKTT